MAHIAGPLFRRIGDRPIEAGTEPTPFVSNQHAITVRQDAGGETNGKFKTQPQSSHDRKFIIAVDFGTTHSTVSYAKVDHDTDAASLGVADIQCINNYKKTSGGLDARANLRVDNVATEILYFSFAASSSDVSDSDYASDSALSDTTPKGNENHRQWIRSARVSLEWGFRAQEIQRSLQQYPNSENVKFIKLTLGDEADDQAEKRRELAEQIQRLRSKRFVENRDHVLEDYLTCLLHHAKCMLREEAGLQDHSELEFVLCVPVSWSESACRVMHDAMAQAIQNCSLAQNTIIDLFIVSEPEAAAQFVLASLGEEGRLRKGEVLVLLDAGGGTVGITTYEVASDSTGPLRLKGEMIPPDGAFCGSSLISERYAAKLKSKLQAEALLDGTNLEARVTALTYDWDLYDKPAIDFDNSDYGRQRIFVHGCYIQWEKEEIRALFEPSLKGVTDLLEKQLHLAAQNGLNVGKLIVVGGFGESPSLRSRIEKVIATKRNITGANIVTLWPRESPTSAVARGAVLRALNKRDGPDRISRSSFGFLLHEQYGACTEHEQASAVSTRDSRDHYPSVKDTICWVVQAGTLLSTGFETKPIVSRHTFKRNETELICVEELYSSPRKHRSHFQNHHPENQGASVIGRIEIDMSEFLNELPFEPEETTGPQVVEPDFVIVEFDFVIVELDLVIVVEGRQLKYEARWPAGTDQVRVRKRGYVSLAPSFVPGTE